MLVWHHEGGRKYQFVLAIARQIKIRASRSGIEALAGFPGQRAQPAKALSPEDYLNIYGILVVTSRGTDSA